MTELRHPLHKQARQVAGGRVGSGKDERQRCNGLDWKLIDIPRPVTHNTSTLTHSQNTTAPTAALPYLVSIRLACNAGPGYLRYPTMYPALTHTHTHTFHLGTYAAACSMSGANKRRATLKRQASVSPQLLWPVGFPGWTTTQPGMDIGPR